ncbi:biotin-dependent carboxyltransferase family protein [Paraflavisolibacter sp. H34]|uniref:5-oxoprolinase subunit C family protein n=1 Tax=Huijunlia imazamoxiresistens TaxID=3127457 RepID=UPI003016D1CF
MSLKIIKAGILDTVQDLGRFGGQHSGINPGGAMDRFSARLANSLLGRELGAPVLELHFPASRFLFERPALMCLTGADFAPTINDQPIPLNQPLAVGPQSVLAFTRPVAGARSYLALLPGLRLEPWLHSYSTHLGLQTGGWKGRGLQKDDVLAFEQDLPLWSFLLERAFVPLHWKAVPPEPVAGSRLGVLRGFEWDWLTAESVAAFWESSFRITRLADRMGFRLSSRPLAVQNPGGMVSSPVAAGTVQLLPDGQLIVLMADHQTTGGYPRIANLCSVDLDRLAQLQPNDEVRFTLTSLEAAEEALLQQQDYLQELQLDCREKLREVLGG